MEKSRLPTLIVLCDWFGLFHAELSSNAAWHPLVDVIVSANHARIRFELAGVSADTLEIALVRNCVRLRGHRPAFAIPDFRAGLGYRRAEIQYGAFERTVELPWPGNPVSIQVQSSNGLITVDLEPLFEHSVVPRFSDPELQEESHDEYG